MKGRAHNKKKKKCKQILNYKIVHTHIHNFFFCINYLLYFETQIDVSLFCSQLYNVFPKLVSLFPGKHHQLFKYLEEAREYFKREAQARMNNVDPSCPQDFIEAFVLKMKEVNH